MSWKFMSSLKPTRESFEFLLSMIGVMGFFILAVFKNVDASYPVTMIIATFITSKTITKGTAIYTAGKDETADLRSIVKDVEGLHERP